MNDDPMERIIAEALGKIGMAYTRENEHPSRLDFRLTDNGVEIEVKRFHSPRISDQMARSENVIAIQGAGAVRFFAALLHRSKYRGLSSSPTEGVGA